MGLYHSMVNSFAISERLSKSSFLSIFLSIQPLVYTISGLVAAFLAGWMIMSQQFLAGAVLIAVLAACDILDGMAARHQQKASRLGHFLDSVVDRLADVLILFSLLLFSPIDYFLGVTLLVSVLLHAFLRTQLQMLGVEDTRTLLERGDRIVLVFVLLLFLQMGSTGLGILTVLMSGQVIAFGQLIYHGITRLSTPTDPRRTTLEDDEYVDDYYAT